MKDIAITGARGFVGSMLAHRFEDAGWTVTRLSHSPAPGEGDTVSFALGDEVETDIFRSRHIAALVHCAYDFRPVSRVEIHRVNVEGSRKLLAAATGGGVERIELRWFSSREVDQMIANGTIKDAKTIVGFLMWKRYGGAKNASAAKASKRSR